MPPEVKKTQAIADLNDLLQQSQALIDEAEQLMQAAENDGRELTDDEQQRFDDCLTESDQLKATYQEQLAQDAHAARRAALAQAQDQAEAMPQPRSVLNTPALSRVTHMQPRIMDDPKRGFAHMGEFAAAVHASSFPGAQADERLLKIQAAVTGMGQAISSEGGALVPPEFSRAIWDGLAQAPDNLLNMCDQYTVTGESLTFPANAETARTAGNRYGGVRGYWINEGDQITASAPKGRQLKLEPQQLAVLVYATDKLLRNATALSQYITRAASDEINFLIGDAIVNGNGVGQPLGVINSGAIVSVAKESGQTAATIVSANIYKMHGRLHPRARVGAVWLINVDCEPQLLTLASDSSAATPIYLAQGTGGPLIQELPTARMLGKPVIPVEYCATVGSVGDILLVNLGFYAAGVRGGGIDSAMSMHLRFDYAETAFRFMFEVDGQSWLASAITPANGTNTLSPFISLAVRA